MKILYSSIRSILVYFFLLIFFYYTIFNSNLDLMDTRFVEIEDQKVDAIDLILKNASNRSTDLFIIVMLLFTSIVAVIFQQRLVDSQEEDNR